MIFLDGCFCLDNVGGLRVRVVCKFNKFVCNCVVVYFLSFCNSFDVVVESFILRVFLMLFLVIVVLCFLIVDFFFSCCCLNFQCFVVLLIEIVVLLFVFGFGFNSLLMSFLLCSVDRYFLVLVIIIFFGQFMVLSCFMEIKMLWGICFLVIRIGFLFIEFKNFVNFEWVLLDVIFFIVCFSFWCVG